MLRTNRETFPDELTGPHVEHLTGVQLALGQGAEEVMAGETKMKPQVKLVRGVKRELNSMQYGCVACGVHTCLCGFVCLHVCPGCVDHHSTLSNFINVIPCPSPDGLIAIICGSLQIKAQQ